MYVLFVLPLKECGEHQAQFERCLREKKMVEKELESINAERPAEIRQTGESMHNLQTRACLAERAKDDALVRLEAQVAQVKRLEVW